MTTNRPHPRWIWRNGAFVEWENATLHVASHVVHYGSSVFEGVRCYDTAAGPSLFRLDDHLRRLNDSARICRIRIPFAQDELAAASCELIVRNGLREGYLRPVVYRGEGGFGVDPRACAVQVCLICWPWGAYLGGAALERGVDACVSSWSRPAANTHPALAKLGGNYLNAQLIKMDAAENGFAEGIALSPDGMVSEGSAQNVFLVRDGVLETPACDGSMLMGITRDSVLTIARELGYEVREGRIPRERLYVADEVFLTGTASEITPVRSVDHIMVGDGVPGPVTLRLQAHFLDVVRGRVPDSHGWRTVVQRARAVDAA